MRRVSLFLLTIAAALMSSCGGRTIDCDVCVYGGTASGVIAAYSAAQLGKTVVIVEPSGHIGGMTTGGLGYTDIGNKYAVSGIARQFYRRIGSHYGEFEGWIFEPHVASDVLSGYLKASEAKVVVGSPVESVAKDGTSITCIVLSDGRSVKAGRYIDCSYEGDLMARAGVSYAVGREANSVYDEDYDGVQLMDRHQFPDGIDPYVVPGDPSSGLLWGITGETLPETGSGDSLVQAYNYRICLTDEPGNMIPIDRPDDYDPSKYALVTRILESYPEKNRLCDWFIWSIMPGHKTDVNNFGPFSTDMIGAASRYPEADYAERAAIIAEHESYTKGMLYFFGHDKSVPEELRCEILRWGYPKDEYVSNGNWTPQLYVRECRRMVGGYVATQADCQGNRCPDDGIAMAAYTMDSHNCRRIVVRKDGRDMVKNEGNVEIKGGLPYPVSYRSIVPIVEECDNLLVPVCLSASHIAYGSIRMEPVFMMTGQAAGMAASMSIDCDCAVQEIDVQALRRKLAEDSYLDGSQPDILVDDSSASFEGEWLHGIKGGYMKGYRFSPAGSGPAKACFRVCEVPSDGEYELYSYELLKGEDLPARIRTVVEAGGCRSDLVLDRSQWALKGQSHGDWIALGKYSLSAGDTVTVTFDNSLSPESILPADAVLLCKSR